MSKPNPAPTSEDQPDAMSSESLRTYNSPRLVERHANILMVAREALAELGFHGVTMNDLANRAGVTKKTLYNVYGNKEKLLVAAVGEIINLYRWSDDEQTPGIATLIASRHAAIAQVLAQPSYANAMTSALIQADGDHPLVEMLLIESVRFTQSQLQADINTGHISTQFNAEFIAKQIVSQGWGTNLLLHKGAITEAEYGALSLSGMLLILKSISLETRQEQIDAELHNLQTLYQHS